MEEIKFSKAAGLQEKIQALTSLKGKIKYGGLNKLFPADEKYKGLKMYDDAQLWISISLTYVKTGFVEVIDKTIAELQKEFNEL